MACDQDDEMAGFHPLVRLAALGVGVWLLTRCARTTGVDSVVSGAAGTVLATQGVMGGRRVGRVDPRASAGLLALVVRGMAMGGLISHVFDLLGKRHAAMMGKTREPAAGGPRPMT